MVALRIESLNAEVSFSPRRPSSSLVERQSPQIAGSEDFILLEAFSVNPLTTRLLFRNPKAEYTRREYYLAVGRNPRGSSKNTNIIRAVLEDHGVNNMMIPFNLIPVVDQALGKIDADLSEANKRAKDPSNVNKSFQDIHREIGHQQHPTGWETRRTNIAAREIAENERIQRVEHNEQTLTEIYETGYNRIVRFIAVRIGNTDEAQDLASEVFVRAWKRVGSYKDTGAPMEAWLFKIARNLTINHARDRKKRGFLVDIDNVVISSKHDNENLEYLEEREIIKKLLQGNGFNDDERRVLELRFVEDMSFKQIAQSMGKTEGAAKILQYRTIGKLRELLTNRRL